VPSWPGRSPAGGGEHALGPGHAGAASTSPLSLTRWPCAAPRLPTRHPRAEDSRGRARRQDWTGETEPCPRWRRAPRNCSAAPPLGVEEKTRIEQASTMMGGPTAGRMPAGPAVRGAHHG